MSASQQNVFFGELLDALAEALRAAGLHVERAVDRFPPIGDRAAYVFVPHEFLPLVEESARPSAAQLRRTVSICTEQPGTSWFETDAETCARSGASVDINALGTAELRRRGVAARYLQLGYIPSWDTWLGDETWERPIDFTFMGGYTPRRAGVLARCGLALSTRRAAIQLSETVRPHLDGSSQFLAGEPKWHALRDSRLLLNVHRSELGYLEWQRIVEAMINGCVVLSEHSSGLGPLEPGRHMLSVSLESVPMVLSALLDDEDRLSALRDAAYRLLRDELPLARTVEPLVDAVDALAAAATGVIPRDTDIDPRPLPPPLAPTPLELLHAAGEGPDTDVGGPMAVPAASGDGGAKPQTGRPWERSPGRPAGPVVSVLLTVGADPTRIAATIASVAASELDQIELVVALHAGDSSSVAAVELALSRSPRLASTTISVAEAAPGTALTRNAAVTRAAGGYVFTIDSGTILYPHALSRLLAALKENPDAGFAYGICERSDARGSRDLSSWLAWDPARLRYGDFIGTSALIHRDGIESIGGYPEDERLAGWEAFALWCAFADRGWDGVRVAEILTRQHVADSDTAALPADPDRAWLALASRSRLISAAQ